jgi:hypothetical protein
MSRLLEGAERSRARWTTRAGSRISGRSRRARGGAWVAPSDDRAGARAVSLCDLCGDLTGTTASSVCALCDSPPGARASDGDTSPGSDQ